MFFYVPLHIIWIRKSVFTNPTNVRLFSRVHVNVIAQTVGTVEGFVAKPAAVRMLHVVLVFQVNNEAALYFVSSFAEFTNVGLLDRVFRWDCVIDLHDVVETRAFAKFFVFRVLWDQGKYFATVLTSIQLAAVFLVDCFEDIFGGFFDHRCIKRLDLFGFYRFWWLHFFYSFQRQRIKDNGLQAVYNFLFNFDIFFFYVYFFLLCTFLTFF